MHMARCANVCVLVFAVMLLLSADLLLAQDNIYEIRKLSDEDWQQMTTHDRLKALNISNNHARSQTFLGDFGRSSDLYPRWGYDYYEMNDRYENYAFRGFENYNIVEDRRQKWYYNQFGDRLTKMTRNAQIWFEQFNDDGTYHGKPIGYVGPHDKPGEWDVGPTGYINDRTGADGIWVARESTDDWAMSVVGAQSVRTKLTPLTVSIPNMRGMKVDFQSANYQASMINSVLLGKGLILPPFRGFWRGFESNALYLRGGQLRRKFGALTIGATYANMYAIQPNREGGQYRKGTVHDYAPTPIFYALRVVDDSPQDGNGPIVHEVKLRVNGRYRPDIQPLILIDDLRRERVTAVTNRAQQEYYHFATQFSGQSPPFDQTSVFERIPKYLDYLYLNDYIKGFNTKTVTDNFDVNKGLEYYKLVNPEGKPIQVNGNEYILYLFDLSSITDKVTRVQAEVTVANDYRIQVSEINSKSGGRDKTGDIYGKYRSTFWKTMAQADGNIKDGSNLRTISVDFGYEVANTMYSFDAHFNYHGFKIDGEFVLNNHYYMFSDGAPGTGFPSNPPTDITARAGKRYTQKDNAYYLIIQKDWDRFGFAGELFKMGKFYRPSMNNYLPDVVTELTYNTKNDFVRASMIEDNDDDDMYPDAMMYPQGMQANMLSLRDIDGVFPGNDNDHDGIPDNDKNFNNTPDYDEPFLMFDVDPDEFVFGDDFNNNAVPDFREDDIKYDLPYDLDRRGHHINLRFTPQENINFYLGSLRTRGIGLDTRTDDDYFKFNLNYYVYSVGKIYAEYRYERIKDNIQDQYVIVPTQNKYMANPWGVFSRYDSYLYWDEVEYRNSKVQRFYLESKVRPVSILTIENHIKYEMNRMVEGTMYDNTFQPKDKLSTLAMVNKLVLTKKWGNWTVSPGIKFRLYKKGRFESTNPLDHYMMRIPLIFLRYDFSNRTNITYGMQGVKGFELLYKDYIQEHNDYRQINNTIQIENRTNYFGFDVWVGFGYRLEQVTFDKEYRKFEEFKSSTLFAQLWLGY